MRRWRAACAKEEMAPSPISSVSNSSATRTLAREPMQSSEIFSLEVVQSAAKIKIVKHNAY